MNRLRSFVLILIVFCICPIKVFAEDATTDYSTYQVDLTQTTTDGVVNELNKADKAIEALNEKISVSSAQSTKLSEEIATEQIEATTMSDTLNQRKTELEARARTMYMYGADSILEILFSSENMTDFVTRADSVASILRADQGTIDELKQVKNNLDEKNKDIANKQSLIELANTTTQSSQTAVNTITAQRQQLYDGNAVAANAYETAKNPQPTVAPTTDANATTPGATSATPSTAASTSTASSGNSTASMSGSDFDLVCAIVAHEGGTSYEGSLAVISCVMNRIDAGVWGGSTPVAILTAPGQFASYLDGYYTQYMGAAIPEVRKAVTDCVEGGVRSHSYTCFRSYQTSGSVNICGNWYFN